jgi:hypothetical protein
MLTENKRTLNSINYDYPFTPISANNSKARNQKKLQWALQTPFSNKPRVAEK